MFINTFKIKTKSRQKPIARHCNGAAWHVSVTNSDSENPNDSQTDKI